MADPRKEKRKETSEKLAVRLSRPDGLHAFRKLQSLATAEEPGDPPTAREQSFSESKPRPISIWHPEEKEGELVFIRPRPLLLGDHYAVQREIGAAKPETKLRICFFGESAAAGYLYAPHITPAEVLSRQLHFAVGDDRFEVIDLARTNERLDTLVETIRDAMQLQPDMLVVFAGNNWNLLETPELSPYYPSITGRLKFAATLREAGVMGAVESAAKHRMYTIAAALDEVDQIARQAEIRVILIIPEVNLGDWENCQPVTWLPGDGTSNWYRLYAGALHALQESEWQEAIRLGEAMLDLDEGNNPTTFSILARAFEGVGNSKLATQGARSGVDSNHYAVMSLLAAPQATSIDQEMLRRAAQQHGFSTVDLPKIFAEYTGRALPDRQLFLDYCHLTLEGISVAMAAVAVDILFQTGEKFSGGWRDLIDLRFDKHLSAEADATARFGAAIHNAHRLRPVSGKKTILKYWCESALATAPGIKDAMLDLIDARTARIPAVLTSAQERNMSSSFRLMFQHGWRYDYLDTNLIEVLTEVLGQYDVGASEEIAQNLLERLAVGKRPVDLLSPPYFLWEPLDQYFPVLMEFSDLSERASYRSPWPVSQFCFVANISSRLALAMSARLPIFPVEAGRVSGTAWIHVNEVAIGSIKVDRTWSNTRLTIPGACLKQGINRLAIRWPEVPPVGTEALREVAARLERGLPGELHPVFGELFSLELAAS